ncbi:MAG: glycosyltransferase [Ktedonobacterales bacterium]|nr:glycosyltransferase [Ktedonobacterales bacterium]
MIFPSEGTPFAALHGSSEGRWPRICELATAVPQQLALLSMHTSPLAQPGRSRDAGGMNVYIHALAQALGKRGNTVDIFTRWTDPTLPQIIALAPRVRLIHIAAGPVATVPKDHLLPLTADFARGIAGFVGEAHYTAIHSHYWLSGVAGLTLAHQWQVPHLAMFHTLARVKEHAQPGVAEPPLRGAWEERIMWGSDGVVVATPDERTQIARFYGAPPERLHVIPCGVDMTRFTPGDRARARTQLADRLHLGTGPVLLAVGRLDPLKGADLLVQMLPQLTAGAHLVLLGGDETDAERAHLRARATELGAATRIRFVDAAPQDQLPAYYRAADLLVVASHYESFGMVAVEALACGTPVVAARVGGLPYIVQDGRNGALVPQRTPAAFAHTLNALLADPQGLASLAGRARASVVRFGWANVAAKVNALKCSMAKPAFPESALAE